MTTDQQQPQAGEIDLATLTEEQRLIHHLRYEANAYLVALSEAQATVARQAEQIEHPVVRWALAQTAKRRRLVALIPPDEAHDGPRYAGFYCEDGPYLAALEPGQ